MFRDNYDEIFKEDPAKLIAAEALRKRDIWQKKYRDTYTWEEFKELEECEDCGYWFKGISCMCWTRR
jgi:hypothetical protein